jgi:hypothetical protein
MMATIEEVLVAYPNSPRIRWRIEFACENDNQQLPHKQRQNFDEFARRLTLELPALHAVGRLAVELIDLDSCEWAVE